LDDRQLPARGIVHARSPCFCSTVPRCYCMSNFTYILPASSSLEPATTPHINALARMSRLHAGMDPLLYPYSRSKRLKVLCSCYWNPVSELRGVTCYMGSHSVTCQPIQVSTARLNPSQVGGWYLTYLPRRNGRLS